MKKILIIDDDADIHQLVKHTLGREFSLGFAENLQQGEQQVLKENFDLIILDESLPDGSGTSFCHRLRQDLGKPHIPVVMLTKRTELKDKLNAFDSGADDYVPKPFEPLELLARVNARLKDLASTQKTIEVGNVLLELASQSVTMKNSEGDEVDIALTPIEFKILYQLSHPLGEVKSRQELLEAIWGKNQNVIDRTVDQHVSKLRKKLSDSNLSVKSLHKKGYIITLRK